MPSTRIAVAQDSAVAVGIGQLDGQQREALAAATGRQGTRRAGRDERHVAIEDQRGAAGMQQRRGLLHGMARAELWLLAHEAQPLPGRVLFDVGSPVPCHHDDPIRPQR